MTADQFISILAAITLIEMMFTTCFGVRFRQGLRVCKIWRLISRAGVANYIFVPCAAIGLLRLFHVAPMIAAGFLIVAVCPGAPYGPPFSFMAKGNVSLAVGLMVILAASCEGLFANTSALFASMAAGNPERRRGREFRAMVLTTAVRNVGVALVVATACFPGTAAVTSAQRMAHFKQLPWRQ